MKRILLIVITLAGTLTTQFLPAQPYLDAVQVMMASSPGSDNQPKKFNHLRAQVNVPIFIGADSSFFLLNPVWDQRWIQQNAQSPELNVQGSINWISYVHQFNRKWSLQMSAIPRWMGTSSLQFSEGFQMGGALLLSYKRRPGLKYQLGVYYNKELFGNLFLPLLGIDWKINSRMNLFGILPGYLVYEHRLGKRVSWGGNFRTFTSSYRISPGDNLFSDDYLRIQDNQLGLYTDVYLAKRIVLNLEAGHTVLRKITTGLENGRAGKDETLVSDEDNFYFRATLQYRMRFR